MQRKPLFSAASLLVLLCGTVFASPAIAQQVTPSAATTAAVASSDFSLSAEEQAWLATHRDIRLGTFPDLPPYEYFDNLGVFRGILADYIEIINQELGVKIRPVSGVTWQQAVAMQAAGDIDVLAFVTNEGSDRPLVYTQSVITTPGVIITRSDAAWPAAPNDVTQTIALVKGLVAREQYVRATYPNARIFLANTLEEGLTDVAAGKTDALFDVLVTTDYGISKLGLENLKVASVTDKTFDYRIGVRNDWPELVPLIDRVLDGLSTDARRAIVAKWTSPPVEVRIDWRIAGEIALVASAVILGILITFTLTNRRLNRLVRERTKEIAASEERTRYLLDSLPVGIVVSDKEGHIKYANPQMLRITGLGTLDAALATLAITIYEDPKDRAVFLAAMEKGGVQQLEFRLKRKNGQVFWASVTSMLEKDGDGFITVVDDITKRRETEKRVRDMNALKSNFITSLAHMARTPITAIGWNAEMLLNDEIGKLTPEQKVLLQGMLDSKVKIASLIENISLALDAEKGVMKIKKTRRSMTSIVKAVGEAMKGNFAQRGIDFSIELSERGGADVDVDAEKMRWLLETLLDNAYRYTNTGGIVSLALEADDKAAIIRVTDDGIGIPKEEHVYAYDLFWRGSNASQMHPDGMGLGLYIAKAIVAEHGGTIDFESEEGEGTTFVVRIPFAKA